MIVSVTDIGQKTFCFTLIRFKEICYALHMLHHKPTWQLELECEAKVRWLNGDDVCKVTNVGYDSTSLPIMLFQADDLSRLQFAASTCHGLGVVHWLDCWMGLEIERTGLTVGSGFHPILQLFCCRFN